MSAHRLPERSGPPAGFWPLYDSVFALLAFFAASAAMFEMLGSLPWLLTYAMFLLRAALSAPMLLSGAAENLPFLFYPAVCLVSVLWSFTPSATLYASFQLLMSTAIALFLGLRYSVRSILVLVFAVSGAMSVLSALHGAFGLLPFPADNLSGYLKGVFTNKNIFGRTLMLTIVTGTALLILGGPGMARRLTVAGLVLLAVGLLPLSWSVTNILLSIIGVCLLLALCWRHLPRVPVLGAVFLGAVALAATPFALALAGLGPLELLFEVTGKDSTLTGRTQLWAIGWEAWRERPLLGSGFMAFWQSEVFANDRMRVIWAGSAAATLHNVFIDVAVQTGLVGVVAMVVFMLAAYARVAALWRMTASVPAATALGIVVLILLMVLVEPGLYSQHDQFAMLLIALAVSANSDRLHRLGTARRPAGRAHGAAVGVAGE